MLSKLPHQQQQQQPLSSSAAASMESSVRRPRGRPPGSKNKPKPPVLLTQEPSSIMSPYILQVPSGNDVVEAINRFCRRKSIGVCVLSGSGSVANVTLRQPSPAAPGSTITFHGKFDLLSVSAAFLPPPVSNFFTVSLAGPQGQIIGGFVAGPLISAGTVYVVAASFNNPSYHRLPAASVESKEEEGQSPPVSGGGGESMYSCHMGGSDVLWAPTARAPPPY
uniref:AT-hook motif nuclear-localized protein n=1 Tax=Noccaea caerulescens TaxID=107243 RepID=A0A1J3G9W0_NOCCA